MSSWERCFSPLSMSIAYLRTHSNRSVCLSCWGPQSWLQYCRWALTWTKQSRGGESSPSPCCLHCFGCSPGCGLAPGLQMHIAVSCGASYQPTLPSSLQGCSQSVLHPACICTWNCPDMCRILHWASLNFIRTSWTHVSSLWRSPWTAWPGNVTFYNFIYDNCLNN